MAEAGCHTGLWTRKIGNQKRSGIKKHLKQLQEKSQRTLEFEAAEE